MIYLIHGDDIIKSRDALVNIKKSYGGNFLSQVVDQDFKLGEFVSTYYTKSIFPEKKRIMVLEVEESKKVMIPEFYEFIAGAEDPDLLLFSPKKFPANTKIVKIVKDRGKILLFEGADDKKVFKLLDYLSTKDKEKSYLELNRLLSNGLDPLYILSMITYQIRNISNLKFEAKTNIGKLHPYVVKKTQATLKNFNDKSLVEIYKKILDTELSIKSSQFDETFSLERLINFICDC